MTPVPGESILLVPDIHQNPDFLEGVLERERDGAHSEVILLGDLLDARREVDKREARLREVFRLVADIPRITGCMRPATLLWGNHDRKYWVHRGVLAEASERPTAERMLYLTDYDLSLRTAHVLFETDEDSAFRPEAPVMLWQRHALLAVARHNHLISHAGVHPAVWPSGRELEDGVAALNARMRQLADTAGPDTRSPLTAAGPPRGGLAPQGGPLWLDFEQEFVDTLPFPQICGHTAGEGVRVIGRSHCLDGGQTTYGVLGPGGLLETYDL